MSNSRSLPFRERAWHAFQEAQVNLKKVADKLAQHECHEIAAYREPLSLDTRKEVTVLLSWGGPSDGFKVYFDEEGEAITGVYFLADWLNYEEFRLSDTELQHVLAIHF